MNFQEQFEKKVDDLWGRIKAEQGTMPAKNSTEPARPAWPNISADNEKQIALFRAEAEHPDTSPLMRSRLASASLKAMGLDDLFVTTRSQGEK
jgi:hypothetical protein